MFIMKTANIFLTTTDRCSRQIDLISFRRCREKSIFYKNLLDLITKKLIFFCHLFTQNTKSNKVFTRFFNSLAMKGLMSGINLGSQFTSSGNLKKFRIVKWTEYSYKSNLLSHYIFALIKSFVCSVQAPCTAES